MCSTLFETLRCRFDLSLCKQPSHRRDSVAARENVCGQCARVNAQVIAQQALEHGTEIGCRLEIALFVEVGLLDARPIGDDAAALERATGEEHDGGGAV